MQTEEIYCRSKMRARNLMIRLVREFGVDQGQSVEIEQMISDEISAAELCAENHARKLILQCSEDIGAERTKAEVEAELIRSGAHRSQSI